MTDLNAKVEALREAVSWMDKMAPDYMNDALALIDALQARIAEVERETVERCAKICDDAAMKNERDLEEGDSPEVVRAFRSASWQMSVCASRIREMSALAERPS